MAEKILNKNVIDRYNITKKRFQKSIAFFRKEMQKDDNTHPVIREMQTEKVDEMLNTIQLIDCVLSGKASKKDMDVLDTLIKEEDSLNANLLLLDQRMALEAKKNKEDNKRRQKEEDRAYSKSMRRNAFIIGGILGLIFGNKKK